MAVYCIDFIGGNNANPGTPASPWKDFANVQTTTGSGTTLVVGDEIRVMGDSLYTTISNEVYMDSPALISNAFKYVAKTMYLATASATDWQTYFGSARAFVRDPSTGWVGIADVPTTSGTSITVINRGTTSQTPYARFIDYDNFISTNYGQLDGYIPHIQNSTWTNSNLSGVGSTAYLNMNVTTAGYSQVVISGGWNATFDGPMTGDWATSFTTLADLGRYSLTSGTLNSSLGASRNMIQNNSSSAGILNAQFGLELKNFIFHQTNGLSRMTGGWYKETNCSYIDAQYGDSVWSNTSVTNIYGRYFWKDGGYVQAYSSFNPWITSSVTFSLAPGYFSVNGVNFVGPAITGNIDVSTPNIETAHTFWTIENTWYVVGSSSASGVTSFPTQGSGRFATIFKNVNLVTAMYSDASTALATASTYALSLVAQPAFLQGITGSVALKSPYLSLNLASYRAGFGGGESLAPLYLLTGYTPWGVSANSLVSAANNTPHTLVTDTTTYTYTSLYNGIDQVDPLKMGQTAYSTSAGNANILPLGNVNIGSSNPFGGQFGRVFESTDAWDTVYGTGYLDSDRVRPSSFNNAVALTHIHNGKTYKILGNSLVTGISDTIFETGTNSMVFKNTNYANVSAMSTQYAQVWQGSPLTNASALTITIRFNKYWPFGISPGEWIDAYVFQNGQRLAQSTRSTVTQWPNWYPGPNATGWTTLTLNLAGSSYAVGQPLKVYLGGDMWVDPSYVISGGPTPGNTFVLEGEGFVTNTIYVDRVEVTPDVF